MQEIKKLFKKIIRNNQPHWMVKKHLTEWEALEIETDEDGYIYINEAGSYWYRDEYRIDPNGVFYRQSLSNREYIAFLSEDEIKLFKSLAS